MEPVLTDTEVRVLGSLIEKAITTPDYYPLSLNALLNACNQSSNREPVVTYDETTVGRTLDSLRQRSLVRSVHGSESRVAKYRHLAYEALAVDGRELAVLCVLLLRGPQTIGEIKTRTGRLTTFASLADVESTLSGMIAREPTPLAARLQRQAGQKEVRFAQLLSGSADLRTTDVGAEATVDATMGAETRAGTGTGVVPPLSTVVHDRLGALEVATEELRTELADLRAQLEQFRKLVE